MKFPLPYVSSSFNIQILNDEVYNIPYIKILSLRHLWCNLLPDTMMNNFWIVSIYEDDLVIEYGVNEYIDFLKENYFS